MAKKYTKDFDFSVYHKKKEEITPEQLNDLIQKKIKQHQNEEDKPIISITDYIILYSFTLSSIDLDCQINFRNCHFHEHTIITCNSKKTSIVFFLCQFFNRLTIGNSNLDSITILNVIINSEFEICDNSKINLISIQGNSSKIQSLKINDTYLEKVNLKQAEITKIQILQTTTLIDHLNIGFLKNPNIYIGNKTRINSIKLHSLFSKDSKLIINDARINNIEFNNVNNQGNITLSNCLISDKESKLQTKKANTIITTQEINDISNENKEANYDTIKEKPVNELSNEEFEKIGGYRVKEQILYEEKTKSPKFEIKNSNIGNIYFKNINFDAFEEIIILDSEISQADFFNSTIPLKKVIGNSSSLYETFNDLYTVALRKNNSRDKVEYYKSAQKHLLKSCLNKDWIGKVPTILSLFTSYIYSNYGTRWTQSFFLVTPFLAFLSFTGMTLATNFDVELSKEGFKEAENLISYYLQFLNPTHKITFMDNEFHGLSKKTWFVFFDLIGRITVSIGIYETIRSFRKYSRK